MFNYTCTFHGDCDCLSGAMYVKIAVFGVGEETFTASYTKLRPQSSHYVHLRLVVNQESLILRIILFCKVCYKKKSIH